MLKPITRLLLSTVNLILRFLSSFSNSYIITLVFDSGSNQHISCSQVLSNNPQRQPNITIPNLSSSSVRGSGAKTLPNKLQLHNVLYVPQFKFNLISISKVTRIYTSPFILILLTVVCRNYRQGKSLDGAGT